MNYDNTTLKELLEDIINTLYGKNPVILKNIWDGDRREKLYQFFAFPI